ncbi:MAG: LamG-like jellyroll fold domain-containing protein [Opitutales bacterium]|nr:LamG-like jellyroll fold domain-containing protein [Opitutales bacterium]
MKSMCKVFLAVVFAIANMQLFGTEILMDLVAQKDKVLNRCKLYKSENVLEKKNGFVFTGQDSSYMFYNTPQLNESFAVAMLVKLNEYPKDRATFFARRGYNHMLGCDKDGRIFHEIYEIGGKTKFFVNSETKMEIGRNYQIIAVFDTSNNQYGIKLYVNGILEGASNLLQKPFPYKTDFILGNANPNGRFSHPMCGTINNVRLWQGVPNKNEMQSWQNETASAAKPSITKGGTVSVREFGAIAGDGKDDTKAVRHALDFAVKNGAKKLVFPKGIYNFAQAKGGLWEPSHWLFWLKNVRNLEIDGQGSLLIFEGTQCFAYSIDCENVVFKNFNIDYDKPFFTYGKVSWISPDKSEFDLKFDNTVYRPKGGEGVPSWSEVYGERLFSVSGGLFVNYQVSQTRLIAPNLIRVSCTHSIDPLKNGMEIMLRHHTYSGSIFRLHHSKNHKIENINIYSGMGMGIVGQYLDSIEIKNVNIAPAPDSKVPYAISSDAINLLGCYGKILVKNCYVKGSKDDSINVFSNYYKIKKQIAPNKIQLHSPKFNSGEMPQDKAGDTLVFMRKDLKKYAYRKIKSITQNWQQHCAEVEFEEPLPEDADIANDIISTTKQPSEIVMRNCKLDSEGRICCQASNMLVEDCELINSGGFQLNTCVQPWFEGVPSSNVVVRRCSFINSKINGHRNLPAVIIVSAEGAVKEINDGLSQGEVLNWPVHSNVEISNNKILGGANSAMLFASVKNLVVKDNFISDFCTNTEVKPWRVPTRTWNTNVVNFVAGVENAVFKNNTYKDKNGKPGVIAVGLDIPEKQIELKNNKGFVVELKDMFPERKKTENNQKHAKD